MRTPNLSKFYRPHTCPSCKVKFKAGQRHKEMCALGASSPNGNNGYRERLALLLKDNEKEKEKTDRRRWDGYVVFTEPEDHSVSRIFLLQSH